MRREITKSITMLVAALCLLSNNISAQSDQDAFVETLKKIFNGISFSGQWFLSYQSGRKSNVTDNEFLLKRGYITFQKKFDDHFAARITQDVSVDREGDGEGDIEIRLKYGYLRYQFGSNDILHKPQIEFGLVSRPWIDFEQGINPYRVQGTMFLERYGILSSADYGITFLSLLGGEIDEEYQKKVNKNFPGRYGSVALGIYNGGGYHAIEKNENKLIEGRLSLRPLPDIFPGLQLSYVGAYGKGNSGISPEFKVNTAFLSFETELFILTGTYYEGKGFENGEKLSPGNFPYSNNGYSIFTDINIPQTPFSLLGRYDYFNTDASPEKINYKRMIVGISYAFLEGSKIIFDYDRVKRSNFTGNDDYIVEAAVEFRY